MKKTKVLSYDKMVEMYEYGKKDQLPESFIQMYEKGYGDLLTDDMIKNLSKPNDDIIVENPHSGVKVKLNPTEFALYDTLMGLEEILQFKNDYRMIKLHSEIKAWFRCNSDCYMDLID